MDHNKQTILIVEDNHDLLEELTLIFCEEGYDVSQAVNGVEAITVLEVARIDLIITDIHMPKMDGLELGMQARDLYPDSKIILITGGGRQLEGRERHSYLDVGGKLIKPDGLLKKPFDTDEALEMVAALLKSG